MEPETREVRLRRLAMRSQRRGIKEMDLILGGFATQGLDDLSLICWSVTRRSCRKMTTTSTFG